MISLKFRAHALRVIACFMLAHGAALFATQVGDTYESVIAEKGAPKSQIQAGAVRLLTYPDVTIKLRDDVVVSVKAAPVEVAPTAPSPKPSARAAPSSERIAQAKKALKEAIDSVNAIVNQPVPFVARTRQNWEKCGWFPDGWFHPGATTPDFNNVDIRKTQETSNYTDHPYASSNLTQDRAFITSEMEFNSMTKFFYQDRSLPKKKLTEDEMLEINRLYRIIGRCSDALQQMGVQP